MIIHTDETTGDQRTIVEGYPQNKITEDPLTVLFGEGWGNLQKELMTNPRDIAKEDTERIPVPKGKTEEEFVADLEAAFNSYDDGMKYEAFPDKEWTGNSNSLVGSVLRKAGSDFAPYRNAPGFKRNVLPGNRASRPNGLAVRVFNEVWKKYILQW
jgi:hypothetical protein